MMTHPECHGCLVPQESGECPFLNPRRAWAMELGCTAYADSLYTIAQRERERREYLQGRKEDAE